MIGIYIISNIKNGKVYIGSSKAIQKRLYQHKYLLKNNKSHSPKLQNAYNKYGKESFIFAIIECCKEENLKDVEKMWIEFYDCVNKGYNCSNDTECSTRGLKHSDDTRKKMSLAQKKLTNLPHRKEMSSKIISSYNKTLKGVPKSDLHRKKISESNMGKKMSEDTKTKQSIRMKKNPISYWKGKKMPLEMRKKLSISQMGKTGLRSSSAKKILQLDLSGNIVNSFYGAFEASRETGISRSAIKNCLIGLSKSSGGFKWEYYVTNKL